MALVVAFTVCDGVGVSLPSIVWERPRVNESELLFERLSVQRVCTLNPALSLAPHTPTRTEKRTPV